MTLFFFFLNQEINYFLCPNVFVPFYLVSHSKLTVEAKTEGKEKADQPETVHLTLGYQKSKLSLDISGL